jgi:competence protein ComEC
MARVLRDWFADLVRVAIPEPESSLGIGYLVGQRRSLPVDLTLALQMAGLTHVVVASGYNLTILVRMSRRLFAKISKYLSVMVAGFMIIAFILITGLSPSMMRAGLVAALSLAAWYYGRNFHPITLLSIAVALTIIIDPSYAWGDLGWQLSFMAFGGVMILAPLASRYLFGDKKPGFIGQVLIETVSAQILTAPILIAAFGQISNVAIVTNLLVLPLVPLAMLLTFIAGLGSLAVPSLAVVIAAPATWLLGYMVNVAQFFAGLPWAVAVVKLEWWGEVICYLFIAIICLYLWRVTGYNLRSSNLVE